MLELKIESVQKEEEMICVNFPCEFKNLQTVNYNGKKYYNLSYNKEKVLKLKHL